ncbi:MAG: YraN family protein, partial [Pseudomonadota bacterium]|nr:YraN family protein [Pseudomonadota bacterium]
MDGNRTLGNHFEGVAARYLKRKGVRLIERNVYNRGGEIDLIGEDG